MKITSVLYPLHNKRKQAIAMTKGITLEVPFNKKTTKGDCGFSHATAIHWNKLPEYIRQTEDISTFRKLLKTHYFRLAYET